MQVILASASPRRREILDAVGIEYKVVVPDVSEDISKGLCAEEIVKLLSGRKAEAVAMQNQGTIVAADTIVSLDGEIFGKPSDKREAFDMLKKLSGRKHNVYTGVTVIKDNNSDTFCVRTEVEFFELTDEFIMSYIESGEPMDKAGAYGIQGKGALMVKAIYGDYFNVVGLPVSELARHL